jgi:adenylate cyclase
VAAQAPPAYEAGRKPARDGGANLFTPPSHRKRPEAAQSGGVDERLNLKKAAERVGVSPSTLRRWAQSGVIPEVDGSGEWSAAAVAHARIVARLRERGHRLEHIREAGRQGRLAYGYMEELFTGDQARRSLKEATDATGLEPALIERFWASIGLPPVALERLTDEDVEAFNYVASVLAAGFPLVAFLQLCRVYGQALSRIADAEVRLFHIYVHEPLMREGVPGLQMAEEMESLASDLLPLASPLMDYVHTRYLRHFVEQDVVGHMEAELEDEDVDLGRVRVAIAFADLAGYTRFTEEEGEEEAMSSVERFVERVMNTLPEDARVVKTIGDEVMVVGQDVRALVDWAVAFASLFEARPAPRIGVHWGTTLYRDGDYFGREVNLASRVVARARGGEVLVTDSVVEAVRGSPHLGFEEIGTVKLKGFEEPLQLCRATPREA